MLTFTSAENHRLNIRAVAVIIQQNMLLIHKAKQDDFWSLPGGRVEFFEHSDATIVRELKEELGEVAKVVRPLWYAESFFSYEEQSFHEIATYYLTELVNTDIIAPNVVFDGIEEDQRLIYQWVPLEQLNDFVIFPKFITARIHNLPTHLEFIKEDQLGVANKN